MSSLVADFIINPVLRQARRFSSISRARRGGATADGHVESLTDQGTSMAGTGGGEENTLGTGDYGAAQGQTGTVASEGQRGRGSVLKDEESESTAGVLNRPPVTSPPTVEEEEREDESTTTQRVNDSGSTSASTEPMIAMPMRMLSYRSETTATEDDISNNPDIGIPEHFQDSPTSLMSRAATPITVSTPDGLPPTNTSSNRQPSSILPEDDGMRALRRKIVTIQAMELASEVKARLMHELLTEGYTQSQISQHTKVPQPVPPSPASMVSQERPVTPTSISSFSFWQSKDVSPGKAENVTFHLSPDDLKPTYAPLPPRVDGGSEGSDETEQAKTLGCAHYKRNVKLQCSTCSKWYTCRLCHDEVEDHVLPRRETKNMLCMLCGSAQKTGEVCCHCGGRAGNYYCDICHLWEDDPNRSIYHCNDCGICRVGRGLGKDFFHCKKCGLCMNISMEESHKCIERSTDCDCPICGEYMFTSPQTVVFMRCGHTIHRHCYHAHMQTSYKCPICQQTVVNMETQFRNLDRAIDAQPMPEQFRDTRAMVSCNDCRAKSAVKYHWLGLRCAVCDSYNTSQLAIITDGVEEQPVAAVEGVGAGAERVSPEIPIPTTRTRRYSSHTGPNLAPTDYTSPRGSRSVSPMRGNYFTEAAMAVETPGGGAADPGVWDDEDVDFWGRSRTDFGEEEEEEDDEEDDDESDTAMDDIDDDDEGDEIDRMELFGHR